MSNKITRDELNKLSFLAIAGKRVSLVGADLSGMDLQYIQLPGADLSNTNVVGANLEGANLMGANLSNANFSDTRMMGAKLIGGTCYSTWFVGARMQNGFLYDVDFTNADFTNAKLNHTNFTNSRLYDATFTGAILKPAILSGVKMDNGTDFRGVDLTDTNLILLGQDSKGGLWYAFCDDNDTVVICAEGEFFVGLRAARMRFLLEDRRRDRIASADRESLINRAMRCAQVRDWTTELESGHISEYAEDGF